MLKIRNGLYRIDLPIPRGGFESFLTAWLIRDEARGKTVLMETGPASVGKILCDELADAGLNKIDYLVYTHIHLDHAGGAGSFIERFPETMVLAPERGRRHLIDPSKLIAGSRTSLGSLCDVYGEPVPVPAANMLESADGIDGLTVIDTPGHAPHHSSYIYELEGERILFAGEASGCIFSLDDGGFFMRPATPHKFFYDTAVNSLDKLIALERIDLVCFPHSGCTADGRRVFLSARSQMELWLKIISELPDGASPEEASEALFADDPLLKKLESLPEAARERERFFIRQSARGFLCWKEQLLRH